MQDLTTMGDDELVEEHEEAARCMRSGEWYESTRAEILRRMAWARMGEGLRPSAIEHCTKQEICEAVLGLLKEAEGKS